MFIGKNLLNCRFFFLTECTYPNLQWAVTKFKKEMKNQVIKVLDAEHGKKVIEYFKNKGAYGNSLTGCNVGFYYGITDGGNKIW